MKVWASATITLLSLPLSRRIFINSSAPHVRPGFNNTIWLSFRNGAHLSAIAAWAKAGTTTIIISASLMTSLMLSEARSSLPNPFISPSISIPPILIMGIILESVLLYNLTGNPFKARCAAIAFPPCPAPTTANLSLPILSPQFDEFYKLKGNKKAHNQVSHIPG